MQYIAALNNNQYLPQNVFQQRTDVTPASAAITGSGLYTFGQVLPNGQYNSDQQTKSLIGASASNGANAKDNQYIFYTPNRK